MARNICRCATALFSIITVRHPKRSSSHYRNKSGSGVPNTSAEFLMPRIKPKHSTTLPVLSSPFNAPRAHLKTRFPVGISLVTLFTASGSLAEEEENDPGGRRPIINADSETQTIRWPRVECFREHASL
ncbi:hypothetical protein NPIL_228451 [Nephila pilipes]|uniref:Uncharacterized protein n=1 Tax=Nephila pilipes TaxID=299642 RepID=A0A8X6PIT7_NEPPI|nr:hypothetical protein NPIL_228451 [Nephila pilipes]